MQNNTNKIIAGRTKGNSMFPWIKEGNIIFVQMLPWQDIIPGDIIVYSSPKNGAWIAHRVLKKEKTFLITKGDAYLRWKTNEKVPPNRIIGKAIFIKKDNGEIFSLEKTKFTYYLNRYFPPLWWIISAGLKYKNAFLILQKIIIRIQKYLQVSAQNSGYHIYL